ncbi:hypothetical protein NBRC10513v2_007564 [Rhodotorula toruloides]
MSARLQRLPRSVRRLHLRQNLPRLEDLSAVLSNLRQLRVLSLDSSFDCATILPLLAHELPHLTNLELEANESLKSQHLLRILSGPEKIVKLHTLSLSTSYGSRPPVHASLEPEGLFEVVELAKQEKVKTALLLLAGPAEQPTMPKDYLTSLPPELFDYIRDLVVTAKPKQYLGGISKAFLPSTRDRAFRGVCAFTESAATKLLEALAASPGAASHVNYLTLRLPETAFSSEAVAPMLRTAILHLRQVQYVDVGGAGELAKMLLSPTSPAALPALVCLTICSSLEGWTAPSSPTHHRNLGDYRQLSSLELVIQRDAQGLGARIPRPAEQIPMSPTFRSLSLGGVAIETSKAGYLAEAFRPKEFWLVGTQESSSPMSPRLRRLPPSVEHLGLVQEASRLEGISAVLPNLRQIKTLSLNSSFDCATILPLLAHELPHLTDLGLGANESLTSQHLLRTLSGPEKIVKLQILSLSHSFGSRPSVHASLEPEALIEVVELAEQEKVEVSGIRFWEAIEAKKARDARLEEEQEKRRAIVRALAALEI